MGQQETVDKLQLTNTETRKHKPKIKQGISRVNLKQGHKAKTVTKETVIQ